MLGLGEPSYFYILTVFSLNGVMIALFFLLTYYVRYVAMTILFYVMITHVVIASWVLYLVLYNSFTITLRLVLI